jgi:hypothetical protein
MSFSVVCCCVQSAPRRVQGRGKKVGTKGPLAAAAKTRAKRMAPRGRTVVTACLACRAPCLLSMRGGEEEEEEEAEEERPLKLWPGECSCRTSA